MKKWVIWGAGVLCAVSVEAASFSNLNFEAYSGSGTDYLPGWSWDATTFTSGGIDLCPLVTAMVGLNTTSASCGTVYEGDFSAFLSSGQYMEYINEELGWQAVCCAAPTISQTADVPADAAYLRYSATPGVHKEGEFGGSYDLLLQGSLDGIVLSNGVTTDISSLAGQEATLSFTIIGTDDPINPGSWHSLDQIELLNTFGEVIWPPPPVVPPVGPYARCLEDFHAATLNTSIWEVASEGAADVYYYTTSGNLYIDARQSSAAFATEFWYTPAIYGDWDIVMDYSYSVPLPLYNSNAVVMGTTLSAVFGSGGAAQADVGLMVDTDNLEWFYGVDWGQGPSNAMPSTAQSGMFRLVHTGDDVSGYVLESGSNEWVLVGSSMGFTDDVAQVGIRTWATGAWSGKGAHYYADNLLLVDGQVCLDGMAMKVFGIDSNGAPTVAWDSVGLAETNRYHVMQATNLLNPVWIDVSGDLSETGGSNEWTGPVPAAGQTYYRIEAAP